MSDRSGRNPVGVLTRTAPDWFSDSFATGGSTFLFLNQQSNVYYTVSLFNDSTTGAVLKVYGITNSNDSGGASWMYPLFGTPIGSLVGQCTSVRFDGGSPVGQIWAKKDQVAQNAPYPYPLPPTASLLGTGGYDSMTHLSPFPLAIVPAGWSLVIANTQTTSVAGAAFWYQVAEK
jgi:hypothetical protein